MTGSDERPHFSLVVLAWNKLDLTRACVASLRATTDVSHELILVDNGSSPGARNWAATEADVPVLHDTNLGFARGMNTGLGVAAGEVVVFINNDTQFPPLWASRLAETLDHHPGAGIVLPAVTGGANPVSVRDAPRDVVGSIAPFTELPSGVVYAMPRSVAETVGGWDERYEIASREDLDLLFTAWVSGYEVVLDERVLVEHVGNATASTQLANRDAVWAANWRRFVDKWTDPELATTFPDADPGLLAAARAAACWIERWYELFEERKSLRGEHRATLRELREAQEQISELEHELATARTSPLKRLVRHLRTP